MCDPPLRCGELRLTLCKYKVMSNFRVEYLPTSTQEICPFPLFIYSIIYLYWDVIWTFNLYFVLYPNISLFFFSSSSFSFSHQEILLASFVPSFDTPPSLCFSFFLFGALPYFLALKDHNVQQSLVRESFISAKRDVSAHWYY